MSSEPVLSLQSVHKMFGGITAIQEFSLDIMPGEIVALVGDNGAGKSTLVKIISGVQPMTTGRMVIEGKAVSFRDPAESQHHGIQVVYQDLALADSQTVYMNLFLGRELTRGPLRRLDRRRMIAETEALMKDLDVRIPSAGTVIRDLSGGQRQGIAIARATRWASNLVLMDEPTAALGVAETMRVESIIAGLRARRRSILLVSHNLDQVFRLADRICVLRHGEQIGIRRTDEVTRNEIVSMITGLA
ncbi:sugar ABC transporter ATP-binding protein [Acidisoma cellulosilytica]|uniref:Sugar ABC transporter ATP-binding protein n=1 Tax=Acidisoma cellulosilyticum TaxID=2802395 RepID=A0A963Z469_9PROT|nr:ATP-binding cassette domain-containing protein [Acidisoma cellulosilyticum]MCB8881438.1 sugar ABC transporter ATP-binding protein [Acidisoma cellulosilyticum]